MATPHDLAVATIQHLDGLPSTAERSRHKFNMIRIAEKSHRAANPVEGQSVCEPVDNETAFKQIEEAASFVQANAA